MGNEEATGTRQTFTDMEHGQRKKITKREMFLDMMDAIIPRKEWTALIEPFYPRGLRGHPPAGIGHRISEKTGRRRKLCDPVARWWVEAMEKRKSSTRSKVQHVFRIVRIQFGYVRTGCGG